MCGADVSGVDPASITENKCPYCGFELYNHSREIYGDKIEDVKQAKSKLIAIQIIIAIVATVIVVCGGYYIFNRVIYRSSDSYVVDQSDNMTKKLHKAYEKENWDELYDLVIINADKALSSPYYFSYRAAWIMSQYVPAFEQAYSEGNKDGMLSAFEEIRYEYEYREQLADTFQFVSEIEDKLKEEYFKEKEIMTDMGLLK